MIDVLLEDLIDLRQACREKPFRNSRTGRPAHISSVYRHVMAGARAANGERIKLEVVRTPSGLRTSREAIGRFIATLTNAEAPAPARTTHRWRPHVEQACAELADAGMPVDLDDGS